jgi:hypothetical protein
VEALWRRPLNVDLICNLRVIGWSKDSFKIYTDEGDGYDFFAKYMDGEGPTLKPYHYEEWAEQLDNLADWCRKQAEKLQAKELPVTTLGETGVKI